MPYQVGDRVRIRENIEDIDERTDHGVGTTRGMIDMEGSVVTIDRYFTHTHNNTELNRYRIVEDGGDYIWSNDMLEPIRREVFEVGDTVTIYPGLRESDRATFGIGVCFETRGDYRGERHVIESREADSRIPYGYKYYLRGISRFAYTAPMFSEYYGMTVREEESIIDIFEHHKSWHNDPVTA